MSKKILFFGNERLATGVQTAAPTLQALIAQGYEVVAVVVAQSDLQPSRQARELEVASIAKRHNIPLLSPRELRGSIDQLAALSADAAVLIAYGKLIPEAILTLFPAGIINIHPSLLPLHRGPTPLESVILSGAEHSGVSLMRLTKKMDTGPLYTQQIVPLTGHETKQALADQLAAIGTELLINHLPTILDGSLLPSPQNEVAAIYDQLITKQNGLLDWAKPAKQLEREIRAYAGWPRSRATIGTTDVIITAGHVTNGTATPGNLWLEADGTSKQLGIYCAEDILVIDSLIPLGKKEMSAPAFLAGYRL